MISVQMDRLILSATLIRLLVLPLLAMLLAGCGRGKGGFVTDPAQAPRDAPSFTQLNALLQAEFQRLGIDPAKAVAQAPTGENNAVFDLALEAQDPDGAGPQPATAVQLKWTERLIGDYDQNGVVAVNDLTPIALNFQQSVVYDPASNHDGIPWWPQGDPDNGAGLNWRLARVDGNSDGKVTVQDLVPIAAQFQQRLDGYLIEHGVNRGNGSVEWDSDPLDLGEDSHPSIARDPGFASLTDNAPRYNIEIPLSEANFAHYYRVRAWDSGSSTSGPVSAEVIYLPTTETDTTPPVWTDTVGVAKLIPGNEQITVEFGTATDGQSPPVTYRVYWAEGDPEQPDAPFDYDAADFADTATSPYIISGLTNEQYYRVAVRAADSASPTPNRESNVVLLGMTAGPQDVYPPEWQNTIGLTDLFYGNGQALLVWNSAVDSHTDELGTWESGPVVYRLYHGEGQAVDIEAAEIKEYTDIGQSGNVAVLEGLDTAKPHWFLLRARDQAAMQNEDDNLAAKTSSGVVVSTIPLPPLSVSYDPETQIVSYDYLTSADHLHAGVLRTVKAKDPPPDAATEFLRLDSNDKPVIEQVYDRDQRGSTYAAEFEPSGNLVFAYTHPTGELSNGQIIVERSTGQDIYDLGEIAVDRLGITNGGKVWAKCTEAGEGFFTWREFVSLEPFNTDYVMQDVVDNPEVEFFTLRGYTALSNDSTSTLFAYGPASANVFYRMDFDDIGYDLQEVASSIADGWELSDYFGRNVSEPILKYGRTVYSEISGDYHNEDRLDYGQQTVELSVNLPMIKTNASVYGTVNSLDHFAANYSFTVNTDIENPESEYRYRALVLSDSAVPKVKIPVADEFITVDGLHYIGNGKFAYIQVTDMQVGTAVQQIISLVE